ncbi:MAG: DUF3035 domain-containing protein [Parcubacteria group bacterium]
MKPFSVVAAVALVGAVGLGGYHTTSKALGLSKVTPDEFRVVTKAPLVVPPDYSLRPPAPGEPRPAELQPESAARASAYNANMAVSRSVGEQVLVTKAGAASADPLIRYVVDDEFGDVAHKEKSFADKVLFWRKDKAAQPKVASAETVNENAKAEEERLKQLTGGKAVIIQRKAESKLKLPGL